MRIKTDYPATSKDSINLEYISNAIYPVGSLYMSTVSTNPATILGFGTWEAWGEGRMIVGVSSTDTDFDTVEEIGGAKTKTIAQANLPNISTGAGTAHTHTQNAHTHTQDSHGHGTSSNPGDHSHSYTNNINGSNNGANNDLQSGTSGTNTSRSTGNAGGHTHTFADATATNQNTTATNNNESSHTHSLGGSGTALNVMNPYITAFLFKRTA
jgi:hypothetical protein